MITPSKPFSMAFRPVMLVGPGPTARARSDYRTLPTKDEYRSAWRLVFRPGEMRGCGVISRARPHAMHERSC